VTSQIFTLFVLAALTGRAQTALNSAAFAELAQRCAPGAPLATLRSIASVESAFNPFALSINYPEAAGAQLGIGQGSVVLARQPSNVEEAVRWARWFIANGQTVSVGLLQLNIEHLAAFKLSLERAFDPCTNLQIGWAVFNDKYRQASAVVGKGQVAMHAALSAYNSGSLIGGFGNGYVAAVLAAASKNQEAEIFDPPPEPEKLLAPTNQIPDSINQKSGKMFQTDEPERSPSKPTDDSDPRMVSSKLVWDMNRATGSWTAATRKD